MLTLPSVVPVSMVTSEDLNLDSRRRAVDALKFIQWSEEGRSQRRHHLGPLHKSIPLLSFGRGPPRPSLSPRR